MSLTFTPHWAIPTLFVLLAGLFVSVFTAGCVAQVDGIDTETSTPEVCGGAVCFAPTDVAVKRWGAGELTVVAWRADERGCEPPVAPNNASEGPTTRSTSWLSGSAIELKLHAAKPGARLPVYTRARAKDEAKDAPWATARAIRIGKDDGRALADEETVTGEATILDLDPQTGRVRVRVNAKWSSGVSGEFLVDVDGPHACATAAH